MVFAIKMDQNSVWYFIISDLKKQSKKSNILYCVPEEYNSLKAKGPDSSSCKFPPKNT